MSGKSIVKYGANWPSGTSDIQIEMACYRLGGKWKNGKKEVCGRGMVYHTKRIIDLLWPGYVWHAWNLLLLARIVTQKYTGLVGPASSGKTNLAALWALVEYYCFPNCTTILCSTTTTAMLDLRIWGEIKRWNKAAKELHPWLPGYVVESKHMMITDPNSKKDGRDFSNGIVGVACKKGDSYQGLGNYIGIKNKRVRLLADELQLMPSAFLDSISNLNSNSSRGKMGFRAVGLGNPKDQTDALARFCEPVDGFESVDQGRKTTTWKTRLVGGCCVQLYGPDTPNRNCKGEPWKYPFLITPEKIAHDAIFYGAEHPNFLMMNMGVFSKMGSVRRVITRAMCLRNRAMEVPVWRDNQSLTRLLCLDASYSAEGEGDRTPLIEMAYGPDVNGNSILAITQEPIIVPISARIETEIPDQIAYFVKDHAMRSGIPPERFAFDSTGRGSLALALSRIWSPNVVGIEFGGPASDRSLGPIPDCSKKYKKFVTELWMAARYLIDAGQARGLDEMLIEEGTMRAWIPGDRGTEDVERKADTKIRMGKSPDLFDAYVCGIELARRLGFVILGSVEKSRSMPANVPHWLESRRRVFSKANKNFTLHTK